MRERVIGAAGVVVVGLVPIISGGPVFAVMMTLLCLVGYREYLTIASLIGTRSTASGYVIVPLFAIVAWTGFSARGLLVTCALAVALPLWRALVRSADGRSASLVDWGLGTAGTFYLGLPLLAAIELRQTGGPVSEASATWVTGLAGALAGDWVTHPRGLAWLLSLVLLTWGADTGAFLVGRRFGRRLLMPAVSPKKTVEGAAGGIAAAAATMAIASAVFGLGLPTVAAVAIGCVLGAAGQVGDLAQSLMKRQAGVKDSGTLIRGHGGVLDRIDALVVVLVAGLFVRDFADVLWAPGS